MDQSSLFPSLLSAPQFPDGMRYEEAFLDLADERRLLDVANTLPFTEAAYKEWTARRRVVNYGGRYDFSRNALLQADPVPPFLHALRQRIANWSGIPAHAFSHALIAEYGSGVQLGWHRDVPDYESIVGVSLAGVARMRLRPYPPQPGQGRAALSLDLAPRSIYALQGVARWDWQHAISPTKALRYSITFRTLMP